MTGTVAPSIPTLNNPNSSEDPNIRNSLITLRDALNGVLTSSNQLDGAQLGAGTVSGSAIAANSVPASKLSNATAGQLLIANGSGVITAVTLTGDITATSAGVTAIGAAKVTTAMLGPNVVDNTKLANNAVFTSAVQDSAVTSAKVADGAVGRSKISTAAVQTKRGGSFTGLGAGAFTSVTLTWDSAFADTNYTVALVVNRSGGGGPLVAYVISKSASAIGVAVHNQDSGVSANGTVEAFAIHD